MSGSGAASLVLLAALSGCQPVAGGEKDADHDGFGDDDCNDQNADIFPGAPELCDGLDQDCNGVVDDVALGFLDGDGDGYGAAEADGCDALANQAAAVVAEGGDCDDTDPSIHPNGVERCDSTGRDEDCDGLVDDDDPDSVKRSLYSDSDGDGFGDPTSAALQACGNVAGRADNALDCDDRDAGSHPGATELCDGLDQDCDGAIDEDAGGDRHWFYDGDGDGYGDDVVGATGCVPGEGFVSEGGDCDDTDALTHPLAPEDCDSIDRDCDGDATDGATVGVWSADSDGDGHGDAAGAFTCTPLTSDSPLVDDCNDHDASIHPGMPEDCSDGVDQDCDGRADECEVSLSDSDTWSTGSDVGQLVGSALAWIPDVDGDGADEVVVGAYGWDDLGGLVVWREGASAGGDTLGDRALAAVASGLPGARFGTAVVAPGDVDGDGEADVVVGASGLGAVFVFPGSSSGAVDLDSASATLALATDVGVGLALSAGDVNDDGLFDLLVPAPAATDAYDHVSGAVAVFLGPVSGELGLDDAEAEFTGGADSELLGRSVDGRGDLDGDGLSDAALGAPYASSGPHAYAGREVVFLAPFEGHLAAGDADALAVGDDTGTYFGWSTCTAGDLDGDGRADLAVGAKGGLGTGRVDVFVDGDTESAPWASVAGPGTSESFAYALDAGDVDGDGTAELLIGDPLGGASDVPTGAAWLVHLSGGVMNASDAWTVFEGDTPGGLAGTAVALGGDANGDGSKDVLIGAPGTDWPSADAGSADLIYGGLWD